MERLGGEGEGQRLPMRSVAAASFTGAFLEWYDFNLYAISAALVLNQLFFPTEDPLIGTLAAFVTFGVGYLFRPVGGLIFGHYGDRVGRKAMLVATMLVLGGATFLIGLLPTYAAIGIWAPILLLVLRLVQGLGLGGEFGGAALMTVEHAPRDKRGFWGSLPQLGPSAGFLLGTGIFSLMGALLSEEQFLSWGWRVPFLLSIVLGAVGLVVRVKILETPAFRQVKESGTVSRIPVWDLVRTYPKNLVLAFGARVGEAGSAKLFLIFTIAYVATQLGLPNAVALTGVAIYNAISLLVIPIYGALSDRIGRRPLYMAGLALIGLYAFPYFWLLNTEIALVIWLALGLAAIGHALMEALQMTFFTELFGTRVRYSGLSVAYQASASATGFLPAIFTSLLVATGASWSVAALVLAICFASLVCTYLLAETFKGDVAESEERLERHPATV